MNDIEKAKKILEDENLTCVILKGDVIYKSSKRGVAPIMDLINKDINIKGFSVADKVIGKAAALLFVLCKIEKLYSPIMSEPAIKTLKKSRIDFDFSKSVPYIINRAGDGHCPMEEAVIDTENPQEALAKIKSKLKELSNKD